MDVGCNGGEWKKITEKIGYTVTGVDHVPWDSVDIIHDCNDLTVFPTHSQDCIQATELIALENIKRVKKNSKKIFSCLNPWGR